MALQSENYNLNFCVGLRRKKIQLHIPETHTHTPLISIQGKHFSQFFGILCEYILSLTRLCVEYVNHVIHKAVYHSLSGATKWWNKHIGAPDYFQVLLSNQWRLMTEVIQLFSIDLGHARLRVPLGVSCPRPPRPMGTLPYLPWPSCPLLQAPTTAAAANTAHINS